MPHAPRPTRGPEASSLFWVDALRVIAASAVVFLHVAAEPVVFVKNRSSPIWWAGNAIDSATRWCVPIFVMLSGALLLQPRSETLRVFFARRVQRIAIPLVAWSALYLAFHAWRRGIPDWEWLGGRLLYGRPEYHMWYVYMTLGLYLFTPLMRRFTAWADQGWLLGVSTAALVAAVVHHGLASLGHLPGLGTVFVMYVPYIGYYLAGYTFRLHPPQIPSTAIAATVALCIAGIALFTRPLMERYGVIPPGLYLYDYLSPPVVVMSLGVFVLGSRIPAPDPAGLTSRWVRHASGATLGIYLIHVLIIRLLRDQGITTVSLGIAGVPIVASLALVISYAVVSLIRRVPLLRHTL